jgi:hypothetical protein
VLSAGNAGFSLFPYRNCLQTTENAVEAIDHESSSRFPAASSKLRCDGKPAALKFIVWNDTNLLSPHDESAPEDKDMFKPLTRPSSKSAKRENAGFAETQFLHAEEDEDYSGFAPTEMFDDEAEEPRAATPNRVGAGSASQAAAASSRSLLARAAVGTLESPHLAGIPGEEALMPASWVTSKWVEAQETKAHEAARRAQALIAAQRRGQADSGLSATLHAEPRSRLGRLRDAVERLLPGEFRSLLPLFICVSLTMALISAVLPLIDKP